MWNKQNLILHLAWWQKPRLFVNDVIRFIKGPNACPPRAEARLTVSYTPQLHLFQSVSKQQLLSDTEAYTYCLPTVRQFS